MTIWTFNVYNAKDFKVKEVLYYKYFIVIIIINKIEPSICRYLWNGDSLEYTVSIISWLTLNAIEFSCSEPDNRNHWGLTKGLCYSWYNKPFFLPENILSVNEVLN